jgi:hypothetical protein
VTIQLRTGHVSGNTGVVSTKQGENTKMKWREDTAKEMKDLPRVLNISNLATSVTTNYLLIACHESVQ